MYKTSIHKMKVMLCIWQMSRSSNPVKASMASWLLKKLWSLNIR